MITPPTTPMRYSTKASSRLRSAERWWRMPYAMVIVLTNVAVADEPAHSEIRKPIEITSARPPCENLLHQRRDHRVDHVGREQPVGAADDLPLDLRHVVRPDRSGEVAERAEDGQDQRRQAQQLPETRLGGQPQDAVGPGLAHGAGEQQRDAARRGRTWGRAHDRPGLGPDRPCCCVLCHVTTVRARREPGARSAG